MNVKSPARSRGALITAQHEGTASSGLVRLFQAASKTAKDVGAQTALGSRRLSTVSVALDLATDLSENQDWTTKKVVVFGTGAYAGATMALLRERGCTDISVFSSSGRAGGFVAARGGIALDAESLHPAVAAADVMIGRSGSDTRVEAHELAQVRADSPQPLIAIDLALAHEFDVAVGELDGVELLALESVRLAAPQEQVESLAQARGIVNGAAKVFEQEREARSVDSAIVALRRHTVNVLESEMEKVWSRQAALQLPRKWSSPSVAWSSSCCTSPLSVPASWRRTASRMSTWQPSRHHRGGAAARPSAQAGCPVGHRTSSA